LSGSDSISRADMTVPTTEERTLTVGIPRHRDLLFDDREVQRDLNFSGLPHFEAHALDSPLLKPGGGHDHIDIT
jgi:hypothetical protein